MTKTNWNLCSGFSCLLDVGLLCLLHRDFHCCCYPVRNEGAVVVLDEAGGVWCSGNKEMGLLESGRWISSRKMRKGFRFPACLRSYGSGWESPRFESLGCAAVRADVPLQACLELSESASHQALVPHPVSHTGITSLSPCSSTAALKTKPGNSSFFLVVRW